MLKYIILSVIVAVATSLIAPRDLVDQAKAQLEQLKSLVQGDILAAHNTLDDTVTEFGTFGDSTYVEGVLNLQQEHDSIKTSVNSIKDLAASVHVDISSCTDIREQVLDRLPLRYTNQMLECVNSTIIEVRRIVRDARRIVDVNLIKVTQLENDFKKCNNNLLCIQPLLTEIELNRVRLPLNIKTEVNAVQGVINTLKITVQGCATDKNAQYNSEASSLLNDITKCADRLMD